MAEFGPDEQKWLEVLRTSDEPSMDDRARVRASVLAGIAGGAIAAGTTAAAPGLAKSVAAAKAAGSGALFASGLKIGLAVVSVALAGGIAFLALHRTPVASPEATASPTQAMAVVAATPSEPPREDVATPAPVAPAPQPEVVEPPPTIAKTRPPARPSAARSSVQGDDVDAELVLLTQAQRALEHGDPNTALVALARHEREHPSGALTPEREGLRAVASCDAKRSNGRALAERFVAAHPTSPLVARIRASCLSP